MSIEAHDEFEQQIRDWVSDLPTGLVTIEPAGNGEVTGLSIVPVRSGAASLRIYFYGGQSFQPCAGSVWWFDELEGFETFVAIAEGVRRGQIRESVGTFGKWKVGSSAVVEDADGVTWDYSGASVLILSWFATWKTKWFEPWDPKENADAWKATWFGSEAGMAPLQPKHAGRSSSMAPDVRSHRARLSKQLRVTEANDLVLIYHEIHDWWLDIDEMHHDHDARTVRIKVGERNTRMTHALVVHNVERLTLLDTERIGSYDLNVIRYDEADRCLRVQTGVPLKLEMVVDALDVQLIPLASPE